jgi:hypothetical protein
MNYTIGNKVKFRIGNNDRAVGEIVAVLEEQESYLVLAATTLGTRKETVVPEKDIIGDEDFDWK